MEPDDLCRFIDDELKRLPAPKAPASLLTRVLAVTVERADAGHRWAAWSNAWRWSVAASAGVVVAVMVAAAWFAPAQAATRLSGRIAAVADAMDAAATLTRLCWRALVEPVAVLALVLGVTLSLACAALWAALDRDALGGASQS